MKKALVVLVVAALAIGGFLFFIKRGSPTLTNTRPFDAMPKLDKASAAFYLEGDTLNTLTAGGVFYRGIGSLPSGGDKEFEDQRNRKIEEIGRIAKDAVQLVEDETNRLDKLRAALLNNLQSARNSEPKVVAFASAALKELVRDEARRLQAISAYRAFSSTKATDPFAQASLAETAALKAMEAALTHDRALQNIAAYAATAAEALKSHSKSSGTAKAIDDAFAEFDDAAESSTQIVEKANMIRFGFRQLETADHHYAVAVSEHMKVEIPKLESMLKKAKPRENISGEDLTYASAQLALLKKWQASMEKHLKTNPKGMVKVAAVSASRYGLAFADGEGSSSYSSAFNALGEIASGAYELGKGAASATWSGLKTVGRAGQRTVQLGADTAGFYVKAYSRMGVEAYKTITGQPRGTPQDMAADMREWGTDLKNNWNGRIPKDNSMRTAKEYFEGVDKGAENLGKWVGQKGGSAASWVMGKSAKVVAGVFTGLGKGIATVSDPTSTTGELVEGGLDIAFAGMGGSKVLIKGSQIPGLVAGAGKEAALAGKLGIAYWARRKTKDELAILREIFPRRVGDLSSFLTNLKEMATRKEALASLSAAIDALKSEMTNIAKAGGVAAIKSAAETAKSSWDDLFKANMRGLIGNLATAMGSTKTEIFDSLFGGIVDDELKAYMASFLEAPTMKEIAGSYPGTLVFTSLEIAQGPSQGSKGDGGCLDGISISPEQIEKMLLDKPLPVRAVLSATGEQSGKLTILSQGARRQQAIGFRYVDGSLVAEVVQDGMNVKVSGTCTKSDNEIHLNLGLSFSGKGSSGQATFKGKKGG